MTVDYEKTDAEAGCDDAHFMDIGQSTWDKEDLSAKIWRWMGDGEEEKKVRWSRQGEELPLSCVLDLAILVCSAATGRTSVLQKFYKMEEMKDTLQKFLKEHMQSIGPKLNELRRILQPEASKWNGQAPQTFFRLQHMSSARTPCSRGCSHGQITSTYRRTRGCIKRR